MPPDSDPSALSRLVLLLRRLSLQARLSWWLPLAAVTLTVAATAAVSLVSGNQWSSTGRMIVNVKLSLPEGSFYTEELSNFLGTQAALMRSSVVTTRAHQHLASTLSALSSSPPTWTSNFGLRISNPFELKVSVLPRTTIFELQAIGGNPLYTRAFVQACMEEYIQLKRELRSQTSDSTLAGLSEQIVKLESELSQAQKALIEFQGTNLSAATGDPGCGETQTLLALRSRLASLESEANSLAAHDTAAASARPEFLKCSQEMLLLKAQEQELCQILRPAHPRRLGLARQIESTERMLTLYREQAANETAERRQWLATMTEFTRERIQEYELREAETQKTVAEHQRLKASVQRQQAFYDRLLGTLQTVDLSKDINPPTVTILQSASEAVPMEMQLWMRLAIAAATGLVAAIGGIWLLDALGGRMHCVQEVEAFLGEPALARIPAQKPNANGRIPLVSESDSRHSFLEACRNLRSGLTFISQQPPQSRVILVTSSVPKEGKSMIISNLALVLAKADGDVLLVDGDLRKGNLHELFGTEANNPEVGFSQVLVGALPWQQAFQPTSHPRLFLLPRGPASHLAPDLFLGSACSLFLKEARARFSLVLIDTPPVFAADDATTLAPQADGVLFVLKAHSTSARIAQAALNALHDREAKCLGIVLNGVRSTRLDGTAYENYRHHFRPSV